MNPWQQHLMERIAFLERLNQKIRGERNKQRARAEMWKARAKQAQR